MWDEIIYTFPIRNGCTVEIYQYFRPTLYIKDVVTQSPVVVRIQAYPW